MDKTLKALYDGEIYPAEQYAPKIEEYTIIRKKYYQHYAGFVKKLESPLDKEFERIMDEQFEMIPIELSQAFIDGFRLGAKMIIEVYEDKCCKKDC